MPSPIEDYALIGDCQTAALVARDGSIDWICFPRFDSPACFAAILGTPENGRLKIAPAEPDAKVRRRYRGDTLVLETEYETSTGLVAIIDFMPPRSEALELVRIVECRSGRVPMHMECILRFDYGDVVPWVRHADERDWKGIRAVAGPDTVYFASPVEMRGENFHTVANFEVSAGERVPFVLLWFGTYQPEPKPHDPYLLLEETERWWQEWSSRSTYHGEWRDAVQRSFITLKALTYAPTGGIVAAPTTSLPEKIGGVRNWDYRYCWLRDATFTLYALLTGGYIEEAESWRSWLINSVAGMPDQLQLVYGVGGERHLYERELRWLSGYESSAPVRIGNAAYLQLQLDIFGEVIDTLYHARKAGLAHDENTWLLKRALLRFLEQNWQREDEGIWEVRGKRRQFTHSKVMVWVALDRTLKLKEEFGLDGDTERWLKLRDVVHREICEKGYNSRLNAFVQSYGSEVADASLLVIPMVGFLPADDPRVLGTVDFIRKRLSRGKLLLRYETDEAIDGLPPGEGVFLLCTFWLADNLALQGRYSEAREIFEYLLSLRNDVGLLSEQFDPVGHRFLGNFPQAFSHIGLINTARNLTKAGGPAEDRGSAASSLPPKAAQK